jgi:hypothetical protein
MYTIQPNFDLVKAPLAVAQKLGLIQHLHNLGWGREPELNQVKEVQVSESEGLLIISGYGQTTTINLSEIKSIQVTSPWQDPEDPFEEVSCVRGTPSELRQALELMGEFDELPQVLINEIPYQCIALPIDFILQVLDDPDSSYGHGTDLLYCLQGGKLYQQLKSRGYELELLGTIV